MKVYVDEIPKCCKECPCMNDDIDFGNHCNMICEKDLKLFLDWDDCQRFRNKDCPLETTQSLKQQVREEVVEEIKEKIKNIKEKILTYYRKNQDIYNGIINDMDYGQIYGLNKLLRILDHVKGETK